MRLLTYASGSGELHTTRDLTEENLPSYAILSHTWGSDEDEVTFQEIQNGSGKTKAGFAKIEFCGQQAAKDNLQHFWVDTCCIDKTNHVELTEAITSMYRWYQNSQICYVYLPDVSMPAEAKTQDDLVNLREQPWKEQFRKSRWFTRGWTLQELLAPNEVLFFSKEGQQLGSKSSLERLIHGITDIPLTALRGQSLSQFPVSERMRWAKGRSTKKKEDQAYCLLGIFNVYMPLIYGEGDHAFVRLTEKINKTPNVSFSLRTVEGATFDAYEQIHKECHPATRTELLQSIRVWARNPNGKSIFWLNGMAGTGKSTISCTVAQEFAKLPSGGSVALGASFFFKRGEGDRASAALLFPTIATQLAASIPHFDLFLAHSIKADPQICQKALAEQFNKLIRDPLQQLPSDTSERTYVLVVDALDECGNDTDIRTMLQLWPSLPVTPCVHLRLFLTSRPELPIRLGFEKMSADMHQDIILHEIPEPIIQHDIMAFLTDELANIRDEYNLELAEHLLEDDWPGSDALQQLVRISVPLFIVAATISRFIRQGGSPNKGLEKILKSQQTGSLSDMGKVYAAVLQAIAMNVSDESIRKEICAQFRVIVGTIVCLAEPLSRKALASLLGKSATDIHACLRSLHAFLSVSPETDALIRPLHLSFAEFLTTPGAVDPAFYIDPQATHELLWVRCLRELSGPSGLREDICCLKHPGRLRDEISADLIDQHLPSAMQYACRYWVYHVQSSTYCIRDHDTIHTFLRQHFIHWLEALSLLSRLADAIELVNMLYSKIATDNASDVSTFIKDARRFVLANRYVGELAPLQLYSSAILFAPQKSIVRNICGRVPSWIEWTPKTSPTWSLELQTLEGHTSGIRAVAFSPNGSTLASASEDGTVRLRQTKTGLEIQKLEVHGERLWTVDFSPDGHMLASGSMDGIVRIWQANTGLEVQKLVTMSGVDTAIFSFDSSMLALSLRNGNVFLWQIHTGLTINIADDHNEGYAEGIYPLAFSPDNTLLAWTGSRNMLRLSQVNIGKIMGTLDLNSSGAISLVFSPDNRLLALSNDWGEIKVWEVCQIGVDSRCQVLVDNYYKVWSIAFSPDNTLLASASGDTTVRLWQVSTGTVVQRFKGHTGDVCSVAFSPDSAMLASGGYDQTVRLWQVTTDISTEESRPYDSIRCLAVSPDRTLLASASLDQGVRLWQTNTGLMARKFNEYTRDNYASILAFLSDDCLLAWASSDKQLQLWEISTGLMVLKINASIILVPVVAISPEGSVLAFVSNNVNPSGRFDDGIQLWQVSTGLQIQEFETPYGDSSISNMALSPSSSMLALASPFKGIRLLQIGTGRELLVMKRPAAGLSEMAFSPDSSILALGVHDGTVRLCGVKTGIEMRILENIGVITHLCLSADNNILSTNRGEFKTNMTSYAPLTLSSFSRCGLTIEYSWIKYQGQRLLWLPPEYRIDEVAVVGNTIFISQENGVVNALKFKLSEALIAVCQSDSSEARQTYTSH